MLKVIFSQKKHLLQTESSKEEEGQPDRSLDVDDNQSVMASSSALTPRVKNYLLRMKVQKYENEIPFVFEYIVCG